jgi:hypothetical protein
MASPFFADSLLCEAAPSALLWRRKSGQADFSSSRQGLREGRLVVSKHLGVHVGGRAGRDIDVWRTEGLDQPYRDGVTHEDG